MGLFSSIKNEFNRAKKKAKKENRNRLADFGEAITLGAVDPKKISAQKKAALDATNQAITLQTKQKRGALLDQAEIKDEIAQRVATKKRGKRFGLLINSQSGSLLT